MYDIVSDLSDISVKLDRINAVIGNLCSDYFGSTFEWHDKQSYRSLLCGYDEASNFVFIAHDYLYQVRGDVNQLMDSIERKSKGN